MINYLQLRNIYTRLGELTTIHVTYLKKERLYTINTLYSTLPLKLEAGAYTSYALSLLQMNLILRPLRDLVKMSASWSFELTKFVATHPDAIFSLMKWQSTLICLVLSWKTGLYAICNAAWLSQMSFIYSFFPNLNSRRRCLNHMSSHVAKAIARYSALALDLATASCFSLFQDIKLLPIKTQYPEVERLYEGVPA